MPTTKKAPAKRKAAKAAKPTKPAKGPATVAAYLAALPPDRRAALETVRKEINRRLPAGYEEGIQYGMIGWYVPHSLYPPGYHCDPREPLCFAGLASRKGQMSLYIMGLYFDASRSKAFATAWKKTGRPLHMGKSCIGFSRAEDLALDVIGDTVASLPVAEYLRMYEALFAKQRKK